jgi:hypothetical protein
MIRKAFGALLVAAGWAAAQQGSIEEQIRKQAEEVSRLMRESERLLLEISRVERLVETQKQLEEELRKLLPPEGGQGATDDERARQRAELQAKQEALRKELEGMLAGQKENSTLTVQQLEELLKSMPRRPMGGGGGDPKEKTPEEEQRKRMQEKQDERKQHQPGTPRKPEDQPKDPQQRSDGKKPPESAESARDRRIAAWIANLPAEERERINRNDLSRVPLIYRSFLEEYTTRRAKRAAEKETGPGR